jgi:hypothetical protein
MDRYVCKVKLIGDISHIVGLDSWECVYDSEAELTKEEQIDDE